MIRFLLMILASMPTLLRNADAQDVDWLNSVTTPPFAFELERPGRLDPLLIAPDGKRISTWDAWVEERARLKKEWMEFLGPMPLERPPIQLEVLSTEIVPGDGAREHVVVRQLVRYEGEPDWFVEGYLLYPQVVDRTDSSEGSEDRKPSLPGIVALHPTSNKTIDEIAGVAGADSAMTGLKLARRGYVVFCPRCFLWQDVTSFDDAVANHRRRHPRTTGMAKMLYDAMRAVDLLESLEFVDRDRIGAIGHSLGAKEVLYLMAFDNRITAGVASEGGLGFRSTNWNAPWYLGTSIDDEAFPLNHHQVLGMIAPRPFLVLGGEDGPGAADGDRSWVLIDAALPVWKLAGEPVRLGLLNHREGHTLSDRSFERIVQWLDAYCGP
ncbi:MAG: dienelactone hydrolase family protein [Pirellula sp.]|nr:dienelactone hydrolase family protein [Pirellula sp.]